MRQLQKFFITMALLTSGAANADCSSLAGDYSCIPIGEGSGLEISILQSVDDQGGAHYTFNMKQSENRTMTLIADGTDRIELATSRNYNASCQSDRFVMTSSAIDGTDPQTLETYLSEKSEAIMFFAVTRLDEAGVEQTLAVPLCKRK